jgi:hypothetical protein
MIREGGAITRATAARACRFVGVSVVARPPDWHR